VHEHEETIQWCDAKAQKERERHHRCQLIEEGSENEDEGFSDEEQDIDKDNINEERDGGTQVGHPNNSLHCTDRASCSV